jgi:hypothetical protein
MYGYTGDDPIDFKDPTGRCVDPVDAVICTEVAIEVAPVIWATAAAGATAVGVYLTERKATSNPPYVQNGPDVNYNQGTFDGGDGADSPDPADLSDNPGEIAHDLGTSPSDVRQAIERTKQDAPLEGNPDVYVDTRTGEVYPKVRGGGFGDSIGNIWDYLGGRR